SLLYASCALRTRLCFVTSFFFQAEDGIRDFHVTGVQTCALPIFFGAVSFPFGVPILRPDLMARYSTAIGVRSSTNVGEPLDLPQIGKRRVGKECRSRRAPDN